MTRHGDFDVFLRAMELRHSELDCAEIRRRAYAILASGDGWDASVVEDFARDVVALLNELEGRSRVVVEGE